MKCTQYGIYSQETFKNARAMFFFKVGWAGNNFWLRSKKFKAGARISQEGCPRMDLTPPIVCRGTSCPPWLIGEDDKGWVCWAVDNMSIVDILIELGTR